MKILVICQYYYPEPFRITDICEELVKQGNEVMVVTGTPNYPEGYIYEGYKHGEKKDEVVNGVRVHRCPVIARRKGFLFRIANYYSYVLSANAFVKSKKCVSNEGEHFDVVFVNQLSPVMMTYPGIKYAQKNKTKVILYCLDLWPESLVAGGIKRTSLIFKFFEGISKKIYSKVDYILCTSKQFCNYFRDMLRESKVQIEYLPQYAESLFETTNKKVEKNTIDLVFAGNIGVLQSVETIIKAANELKRIDNLCWHIVGDGIDVDNCRNLANDLDLANVVFHGRKSLQEMPEYYSLADAMLITLAPDEVLSMTLPGKIQSYLAAGKPILGAINGEGQRVINDAKCGFCANADDYIGLAECAEDFIKCQEKAELSLNAKEYYRTHFSKGKFFEELFDNLRKVKEKDV